MYVEIKYKEKKSTSKKTLLAIGAHPDDLEFGCSMMVNKLVNEGYDAYYIIATNGESGCKKKGLTKMERIKIRKNEQVNAAKMVGVKRVYFLNFKDGFLQYTDDLRKKLTLLIKKYKPEFVFSFDPGNKDYYNLNLFHRDHRIIAEASFDACFAARNNFIYPSKDSHSISKIFFFGTNKPNYFINLSGLIDFKLRVLACHKSQFADFEKFKDVFKEYVAKNTKKYKYSEAFRMIDVYSLTA